MTPPALVYLAGCWEPVERAYSDLTRRSPFQRANRAVLFPECRAPARTLACPAGGPDPTVRSPRGSRVIPHRQRLAAVAILGEHEAHLSAVQRLALVDAAAWWFSESTLITPSDQPDDHGDGTSS